MIRFLEDLTTATVRQIELELAAMTIGPDWPPLWVLFWLIQCARCTALTARLYEDAWVADIDVDLGLVDAAPMPAWRPLASNDPRRRYG